MTDTATDPTPELETTELSHEFPIVLDGVATEVFMSFGLLRELARLFPNPGDPQACFHDSRLFELALTSILMPRNEKGKPTVADDWTLDDAGTVKDAEIVTVHLVKWAMEHVIRFFLNKLVTMQSLGEGNKDQIEALLLSLPGLKDLASTKASAGPMDFNTLVSEASTGRSPTGTSAPT